MSRFRVKNSINGFRFKRKRYLPGEEIELSDAEGERFASAVEKVPEEPKPVPMIPATAAAPEVLNIQPSVHPNVAEKKKPGKPPRL